LQQTLLQASDDLRVHAAVLAARDFSDALSHAVRKTYEDFVRSAAGGRGGGLVQWAHTLKPVSQGKRCQGLGSAAFDSEIRWPFSAESEFWKITKNLTSNLRRSLC
jgi:hypothetical protein